MLKPDLQLIYEQMREHLLTMPGPAWDDALGSCQYRTRDGNSCLVGCLLTDEAAQEADEMLDTAVDIAAQYFPSVDRAGDFLGEAQDLHDLRAGRFAGKDATEWRETVLAGLDDLADEYGLLSYAQKDS